MTQDQITGLLRQLLPVFGGIAIALGWLTADQVGKWTGILLQAVGPMSVIGGIVWSLLANSKTAIITAAANMPEVKKVELTTTPEAKSLEAATPDNVNVGPTK